MLEIRTDPFPPQADLTALWLAAWGTDPGDYVENVLARSLAHLAAYDEGTLIGFLNLAWDGGIHAFVLDTCVHPRFRHRGIGRRLVLGAVDIARDRGAHWLHVDYQPHLEDFYRGCGFQPTSAGLIDLH